MVTHVVGHLVDRLCICWPVCTSYAQVAEALEGKCRVLKMDSDDESEMASALNVSI